METGSSLRPNLDLPEGIPGISAEELEQQRLMLAAYEAQAR
jgi:hypothetical protein